MGRLAAQFGAIAITLAWMALLVHFAREATGFLISGGLAIHHRIV